MAQATTSAAQAAPTLGIGLVVVYLVPLLMRYAGMDESTAAQTANALTVLAMAGWHWINDYRKNV